MARTRTPAGPLVMDWQAPEELPLRPAVPRRGGLTVAGYVWLTGGLLTVLLITRVVIRYRGRADERDRAD